MKRQKNGKNRHVVRDDYAQYAPQAINRADSRQNKTNVAMPDDDNVEEAKNWVTFNEK